QPLYGFVLVPVYSILGRGWVAVGLAHLLLSLLTTIVVYQAALRLLSRRAALAAAVTTTLQPYLIWHDMHMNREIVDQLLAATAVLLALLARERGETVLYWLLGIACGLVVLGNVRLIALPVILLAWLLWQRRRGVLLPAAALLGATALSVAPWAVRNERGVGCLTRTTHSRALRNANNAP